MFNWYYLPILIFVSLIDQSIGQKTLDYIDGYRSSCKYHQHGTINLIISAPHGGTIMPSDVPNRINGCYREFGPDGGICTWFYNDSCEDGEPCSATTVTDTRSDEFAENVANEIYNRWSFEPYVTIGKWSRKKIDFNREINEATLNYPESILSYQNYHSTLQQAVDEVTQKFGKGLLIDIHGQGAGDYTMVGYLLTGKQLNEFNLSDPSIFTSIDRLCGTNKDDCIRGSSSFGTLLELHQLGIAYPSLSHPKPGSLSFLSGGYITRNYLSKVSAIQTELPYDIRTSANRLINAKNYAQALIEFMQLHHLLLSE